MGDVQRYAFQIHRRPYGLEEVCSGNLVLHSDYAKLEAEAQALREEVAALSSDANSYQSGYDEGRRMGAKHRQSEVEQLRRDLGALRARVGDLNMQLGAAAEVAAISRRVAVMPNRPASVHHDCWEDCEAAFRRLNGKAVSEGLLRRVEVVLRCLRSLDFHGYIERDVGGDWRKQVDSMLDELSALLGEGKEHE